MVRHPAFTHEDDLFSGESHVWSPSCVKTLRANDSHNTTSKISRWSNELGDIYVRTQKNTTSDINFFSDASIWKVLNNNSFIGRFHVFVFKQLNYEASKAYLEASRPMLKPWLCSWYCSTWVDIHFRPSNSLTYTYNSNSTQLKTFTNLNIKVYAGATISIARSFLASNQLSPPTTPRWCTWHVIEVNDNPSHWTNWNVPSPGPKIKQGSRLQLHFDIFESWSFWSLMLAS